MTVLCVVGPTASGKTKMAVALARRLNGEVVSVDSMQIYRGMTIGTAAPTAEEMEGVPHHMIAVADPAEQWSAARFCQAADACIQDILSRGKLPVLAGGTGLYLDALIRGDDFAPGCQGGQTRLRLQQELRELGPREMLRRLEAVDPETARGCTCGTKSASSGPWRYMRRPGSPCPGGTSGAGKSRTGTRPSISG